MVKNHFRDSFTTSQLLISPQRDTPSIFPRSTLREDFGKVNEKFGPLCNVVVTGGRFGSGWLCGPSERHTYCSLPSVVIVTGPENELCFPVSSSKTNLT